METRNEVRDARLSITQLINVEFKELAAHSSFSLKAASRAHWRSAQFTTHGFLIYAFTEVQSAPRPVKRTALDGEADVASRDAAKGEEERSLPSCRRRAVTWRDEMRWTRSEAHEQVFGRTSYRFTFFLLHLCAQRDTRPSSFLPKRISLRFFP